jgi:acetylornithine deacetylase/succinyl-diaminopimelate desuccinylase-like protein
MPPGKLLAFAPPTRKDHAMGLDWEAIQDDAERLLRDLVRFRTVNPPGNETPAAEFVAVELRAAGFDPVVLESAPGRGNVIARLPGGDAPPLLLFGHLDVVPVEAEHWTRDPFGAEIADGFIWGRGTLDMKYIVATQLALFRALGQAGITPDRDIIFAATADEEAGGLMGVPWLIEHHPDLLDAGIALTEFGGFSQTVGGQRFYLCQTAEKGIAWLRMTASGAPGHGSMPHRDSAVLRIAEAASRLGQTPLPMHLTTTAQTMIEGLASAMPPIAGLLDPATVDATLDLLPPGQAHLFGAMLRNTVAVSGLQAGYKHNVIPSTAEATLDCRLIPGQTVEDAIREIHEVVGDEVELEVVLASSAPESPMDTPLFGAMVERLRAYDPEATVLPLLMPGATDGRFLRQRGVTVYGFSPLRLDPEFDFISLVHAHDERIPIEPFRAGVRVFGETVLAACGA